MSRYLRLYMALRYIKSIYYSNERLSIKMSNRIYNYLSKMFYFENIFLRKMQINCL